MIATHNIKVNGKWIHAGEEYTLEEAEAPAVAEEPVEQDIPELAPVEEAEEPKSEPKAETKPRSTRRKKISE